MMSGWSLGMQIGSRARLFFLALGLWSASGTPAGGYPGAYADCPGMVVSTETGETLAFDALAERVRDAGVVLFGEVHGVPEHARASACLLSMLAEGSRPAGLVVEILSVDDQPVVDRYRRENPENAAGLGVVLQWWKRGWPAFEHWLALFDRAFSLRIDIKGGDAGEGSVSSPEPWLGGHLTAVRASWASAMKRAYCELIDSKEAARLGEQQIMRDLSMAERAIALHTRLAARSKTDPAVLVHAGRGHVRKDRSLFHALMQQADAKPGKIVVIGAFSAVDAKAMRETDEFDFVWVAGGPSVMQVDCPFGIGSKAEQAAERSR